MKRSDISQTFLSTAEVADLLRVTEASVRIWVFRGRVPHLKINGRLRFKKSEILDWAESQRRVTPQQGFATVFRDSTIEWISAEKAEQLRREAIPANFEHSLLKSENRKAAERLQRPAAISKTFSKENLYDEHSTN